MLCLRVLDVDVVNGKRVPKSATFEVIFRTIVIYNEPLAGNASNVRSWKPEVKRS